MKAYRRPLPLFVPLLAVLVACSGRSTDRTLPETPSAGAGGSSAGGGAGIGGAPGADGGAGTGGQAGFELESSAFSDMGHIVYPYDCGTSVSPPLSWTAGPPATLSYAVVMVGPDFTGAVSAYHWVIWDIPATTTHLPEGVARMEMPADPAGSSQLSTAVDGATWPGYSGPCPTLPNSPYTFTLYALRVTTLPGVNSASAAADVVAAIQANMLESAELTALATHYRS